MKTDANPHRSRAAMRELHGHTDVIQAWQEWLTPNRGEKPWGLRFSEVFLVGRNEFAEDRAQSGAGKA
jgi:hypothetical protein